MTAHAADLAEAGQFSQATDMLAAAIARCATGDILADELRFRLANVLFLAGSYSRALAEFEAAGNRFAEHYGPDDNAALECRYYAATCKAAIGENTEALAAFRAFLTDWSPVAGDGDERTLDARRQIGLLLASIGHHDEALAYLEELRRDMVAAHGEGSSDVAELAAVVARIRRYDN